MDFGYNDPTVITKVYFNDGNLYIKEVLFESYADSARPDLIDSIKKAGFFITTGIKKINEGISFMKNYKIIITKDSLNTYKEFKHHHFKVIKGKITDDTVDYNNHSIDATRYATTHIRKRKKVSFYTG